MLDSALLGHNDHNGTVELTPFFLDLDGELEILEMLVMALTTTQPQGYSLKTRQVVRSGPRRRSTESARARSGR